MFALLWEKIIANQNRCSGSQDKCYYKYDNVQSLLSGAHLKFKC